MSTTYVFFDHEINLATQLVSVTNVTFNNLSLTSEIMSSTPTSAAEISSDEHYFIIVST